MSKTDRIEPELKQTAESVFSTLDISPSHAIRLLYTQIELQQGLPFEVRIPLTNTPQDTTRFRRDLRRLQSRGKNRQQLKPVVRRLHETTCQELDF